MLCSQNKLAGTLHSILSSLESATWACRPSPSTLVSRSQLIASYGGAYLLYDIHIFRSHALGVLTNVPESLRPHISCCNPNFSVCYFSENETVIMPKLKSYADMDIAMDSDSKEKEEQYIAKLKGELLVEQGKHRLVLENKLVLSLQVKGRVDLDSLLTALQKMGMKVTAEHAQSTDGPENVSIVYISEPKEALIEITPTRTMISVADETTSSLVSEAVRSTLVCNVAAAVSGVAEEEDKEDDKWRIRVEEGAPHGVRVVAAPHSLKSLVPVREPVVIGDGGGGGRVDGVVKVTSLALYSDVYGELVGVEKKASVVCESCKVQCASGYYEYSKDASINLFEKRFKSGNYDKNKLVIIDEASQAIQPSSWIPILQEINSSLLLPHGLLCPLLLLDTRMPYGSLSVGCEEHLDPAGTGSFYIEGEADIVVQHVFSLIYAGVPPAAIAVQSPYVAQV
ncbi:hypothetical protein FXO38_09616 [Capsicum annuum]|nr:hypothetical protein FXO38_09616 [Capsicum annuum]